MHNAKAHAQQAADGEANRLEHAAHHAIAAFGHDHAIPMVRSFAAFVFETIAVRRTVFQCHAIEQLLRLLGCELAENAYRIFAFNLEARMHHGVRQFTRGGEQQQAAGTHIQTPDRQPARTAQRRQPREHGFAPLRIVASNDFAFGLVINQHPCRGRAVADAHLAPVDEYAVAGHDTRADAHDFAIHRDTPGFDPGFHGTPRTEPRLRQYFLQLLALSRCLGTRAA